MRLDVEVVLRRDGGVVWVNSPTCCLGRFSPSLVEVFHPEAQGYFRAVQHTSAVTPPVAWSAFRDLVRRVHYVDVSPEYTPEWVKAPVHEEDVMRTKLPSSWGEVELRRVGGPVKLSKGGSLLAEFREEGFKVWGWGGSTSPHVSDDAGALGWLLFCDLVKSTHGVDTPEGFTPSWVRDEG